MRWGGGGGWGVGGGGGGGGGGVGGWGVSQLNRSSMMTKQAYVEDLMSF